MMSKIAATLVTLYVLSGILLYSIDARQTWVCTPCKNSADCEQEPNDFCVWDEVRDNCGRRACARGPGERCGGPMDIYGRCAEGLLCKPDEKCHGCAERDSMYECFPNF